MAVTTVEQQIIEQVKQLDDQNKERLLAYALMLAIPTTPLPQGTPAEELFALAAEIKFDPDSLNEIAQAIEEDCEQVDLDGWQ